MMLFEPPRDKTNKVSVRPAKTQISLGIRPVWSESSLSAWRKLGPLATHWAHSEHSDQTERMPRLIWVFAGRTATLLVLSRGGSIYCVTERKNVLRQIVGRHPTRTHLDTVCSGHTVSRETGVVCGEVCDALVLIPRWVRMWRLTGSFPRRFVRGRFASFLPFGFPLSFVIAILYKW